MKGVILAGGHGTRLRPLTLSTNKHLLPVHDKPMIYYPLNTLKQAGIKDILVVTGREHAGQIFSLLGSGKDFGVTFSFRVQDEAGGIPQAIALAENFAGKDKFVAINGDNILTDSINSFVKEFEKGKELSRVLLYEGTLDDAKKSGVALLEKDRVVKVIEKPDDPPSRQIVIGVYMYTPDVFRIIRTLKPSRRGELEVSDLHNHYIKERKLKASFLKGKWHDAGTINELNEASKMVAEQQKA